MNGSVIRIVLSILFAAGILLYLFHGAASLQPQATVHSTLAPARVP